MLGFRYKGFRTGFGEVWLNQGVGHVEAFLKAFKTRAFDMDMQTQSPEMGHIVQFWVMNLHQ